MNKKRLLSMLMAAVLSLTSLPVMMMPLSAEAAEEEAIIEDINEASFTAPEDASVTNIAGTGNQYLSVEGKATYEEGINIMMPRLATGTYSISFDARAGVRIADNTPAIPHLFGTWYIRKTSDKNALLDTDSRVNYAKTARLTNDWQEYKIDFYFAGGEPSGDKWASQVGVYKIELKMANDFYGRHPIDIDNIVIKDSNGNVIYTETFENYYPMQLVDDSWSYLDRGNGYKITAKSNDGNTDIKYAIEREEAYIQYTDGDGDGDTTLTYSEAITLEAGDYTLKGSFRNSQFINSHFFVVDGYGAFFNLKAVLTDVDGNKIESASVVIHSGWTEFDFDFTIDEAVAISKIEYIIVRNDINVDGSGKANPYALCIDYKNIALEYHDADVQEAQEITIGEASVNEGKIYRGPAENAGNKYLSITDRNHVDDGLWVTINAPSEYDQTYEVEVKVRSSVSDVSDSNCHIVRLISDTSKKGYIESYSRLEYTNNWTIVTLNPEYTSDNTFTIHANEGKFAFKIVTFDNANKGRGNPFDVDDIKIYKTTGGTKELVYWEDFEKCRIGAYDASTLNIANNKYGCNVVLTSSNPYESPTYTICREEEYTKAIDSSNDGAMTIEYANGGITLEPGVYTLKGSFRNAQYIYGNGYTTVPSGAVYSVDSNRVTLKAKLTGDGFSRTGESAAFAAGWGEYEYSFTIREQTTLSSIAFTLEHELLASGGTLTSPLTVDFKNVTLEYEPESDTSGSLNSGILMVLLAKKKALQEKSSETEEGGAEAPAQINLIFNGDFSVEPDVVSSLGDAVGSVWVKNDYTDKDGVYHAHKITWNDGYITLSGRTISTDHFYYKSDIVLQPGDYTLSLDMKTPVEKETTAVRVGVSGNEGMLFNPGITSVASVGNNWTTHAIKFTVEVATPFQLNIFGGPHSKFTQDFCIDNVKLVKDPTSDAENVPAEPDDGNYIINGRFNTQPVVVSQMAEVVGSAWVKNDGYQDGVYHPHSITWRNGYITLSGRLSSTRHFYYKTDTVLQPGKYVLSVDLKTASSGENTAVRVGVSCKDGMLFDPGITHVASVSGKWMTHTLEFTVEKATSFQLNIFGGPHSQFTQSFCIDNVVLEKVG